jgi:membrane-associated phospholipid phosphatase
MNTIKDKIKDTIAYIGFMGPIITSLITTVSLLENPPYLFTFLFGSLLNHAFIGVLKLAIKQPRPSNQVHYIDDSTIIGPNIYGMPSGHAQISAFAITTLYLTKGPIQWILVSLFIGALTLYQRWSFRRHTIEQLLVGTILGGSFAYILFWITKNYLERVF